MALLIFKDHVDHQWERIKSYVYCVDCNITLYQGSMPKRNRRKFCKFMDKFFGDRPTKEE